MDADRNVEIREAEISERCERADRIEPNAAIDGWEARYNRLGHLPQRSLVGLGYPIQARGLDAEALNQSTARVDDLCEPLAALLLRLEEWMHSPDGVETGSDLLDALQVRVDQIPDLIPQRRDSANVELERQGLGGFTSADIRECSATQLLPGQGDPCL